MKKRKEKQKGKEWKDKVKWGRKEEREGDGEEEKKNYVKNITNQHLVLVRVEQPNQSEHDLILKWF